MSNQRVARPQLAPSPPRGAVFPPGMKFFYNENFGLYDDDVSTLDLEGSVRAPSPSGAMAVIRSPSVVSDGMVHIGDDDDGDDESEISEPAVEIRLWDDEEEEDDNPVIIIADDVRSVIGEDEDEDAEAGAFRTPSPPISFPSYSYSPNRTITDSPSPIRNFFPDHTIFSTPSPPNDYDPDRTISVPPSPHRTISDPSTPDHQDDGPAADPDQTEDEDEDEEMSDDDGIVDYQGPDFPPYVNQAPSHFVRTYRGIITIWSVEEWERDGPAILAEEAAERERERQRRRRRANNGGQSRLARQRAWRQHHRGREPRARIKGRLA